MSLLQSTLALLHLRRGGKSPAPPPPARTVSLTLPSLNGGREQEARDRPGGREQTSNGCSLSLEDRQEPGGMGHNGTGEVRSPEEVGRQLHSALKQFSLATAQEVTALRAREVKGVSVRQVGSCRDQCVSRRQAVPGRERGSTSSRGSEAAERSAGGCQRSAGGWRANSSVASRWRDAGGERPHTSPDYRPLVGETHLGPSPRRKGLQETHLGEEGAYLGEGGVMLAAPPPATRARSYDVLNNCADYQVPENQLQLLRPYQARVQKSLEKLNVPTWFKPATSGESGGDPETRSSAPETPRWRRGQSCRPGWRRDSQSQTSQSSRTNTPGPESVATTPRDSSACSTPCPPGSSYSRWSTPRLPGAPPSLPAPSPAHSNFSLKSWQSAAPAGHQRHTPQPYLGWRSQEHLSQGPSYLSTPAQRLATSALSPRPSSHTVRRPRVQPPQPHVRDNSPNTALHNSIRQVTEAIVDYCDPATPAVTSNGSVLGACTMGGNRTRQHRRPLPSKGTFQGVLDRGESQEKQWAQASRSTSSSRPPSGNSRTVWKETSFVPTRDSGESGPEVSGRRPEEGRPSSRHEAVRETYERVKPGYEDNGDEEGGGYEEVRCERTRQAEGVFYDQSFGGPVAGGVRVRRSGDTRLC